MTHYADLSGQEGCEGEVLVEKGIRIMGGRRNTDNGSVGTSKSFVVVGLILQTIVILAGGAATIRSFEKDIDRRLSAIDAHLTATAKDLEHHIETDHRARSRTEMLLHNTCQGAMNQGCHLAPKD